MELGKAWEWVTLLFTIVHNNCASRVFISPGLLHYLFFSCYWQYYYLNQKTNKQKNERKTRGLEILILYDTSSGIVNYSFLPPFLLHPSPTSSLLPFLSFPFLFPPPSSLPSSSLPFYFLSTFLPPPLFLLSPSSDYSHQWRAARKHCHSWPCLAGNEDFRPRLLSGKLNLPSTEVSHWESNSHRDPACLPQGRRPLHCQSLGAFWALCTKGRRSVGVPVPLPHKNAATLRSLGKANRSQCLCWCSCRVQSIIRCVLTWALS